MFDLVLSDDKLEQLRQYSASAMLSTDSLAVIMSEAPLGAPIRKVSDNQISLEWSE